MAITFNHNDQVYVKDGNLGVGTDNPTYKLTVQGSVNLAGTGAYLRWNSGDMQISNDGSYKMGFYTYNTTAAALVNRMVIDTSGNVGIGTTSPAQKLHVAGNAQVTGQFAQGVNVADKIAAYGAEFRSSGASAQIFFGRSDNAVGSGAIGADASYVFSVWNVPSFSRPFVINQDENVGIGTVNPTDKLTIVDGSTKIIIGDSGGNARIGLDGANGDFSGQDYTVLESDASGNYTVQVGVSGATIFKRSVNESMRIDSSGNVGIGTTSPSYKLHVVDSATEAVARFSGLNDTTIIIGGSDLGSGEKYITYQNATTGSDAWLVGMDDDEHFKFAYGAQLEITDAKTKMTILQNGNVGIGTTSPDSILHVSSTSPIITISNSDTSIVDGQVIGQVDFKSLDASTNMTAVFGSIRTEAQGSLDNGVNDGGKMVFSTFKQSTTLVDQMVIDRDGKVGIGTTNPNQKLHILNGNIQIQNETQGGDALILFDNNYTQEWAIGMTNTAGPVRDFVIYETSTGSSTDATNPRYIFNGNGDGIFQITDAADGDINVSLNTNGDSYLNGGNVGIGETSPSYRLSVKINGDVYSGDFYQADSGTDKYNSVRIRGAMTSAVGYCGIGGSTVANTSFRDSFVVGTQTAHSFNLATSDTARMTIDSSGNVGIGTTSPAQKLHVVGVANITGGLQINSGTAIDANRRNLYLNSFAAGGGNGIFFRDGFTYNASITAEDHNGSSADGICISGYDGISFSTGSNSKNEVVRITGGSSNIGRVGIGTTSPSNRLTVYQGGGVRVTGIASGSYIEISGDLPGYNANQYPVIKSGGTIHFANNGKYAAYLEGNDTYLGLINSTGTHTVKLSTNGETYFNGGNVGIGTTSPSRKLTVSDSGAANGSQNITAQFGNVTVGATSSAVYIGAYTGTDWLIGKNIYGNSNHYNFEIGNQASGSSPVISINNSNNVGIGTISPGAKLDVRADAPSTSGSIIYVRNTLADGSNNTFGGISFFSSPGTDYTIGKLNTGSASALAFSNANNGTEYMRIDSSGNVGIGTDSPGIELDVAGGIRATAGTSNGLRVHTNSGITASNNYMNFFTSQSSGWAFNANGTGADSDTKVVITAGGNVGIGTTAPAKKLTIGGSSPHVLLDGNFDDDSKANQGRVYFNDYNFGIGAGHMSADVNTDDDLYLWTYDGGGRGIRFMSTTNGDTDVTGTAWKTMMVITSDADGGNVGIGTTTPGAKLDVEGLILSDQIQTKEYTSLTGSSGDWFPIGAITDQYTGPVRYSILTYAHSSIDFIVSEAYSLANTHNITVLNSNYGANGGFANVSAVRVRQDGGVEIKLVWSSGPSVQVRITVRGTYGTPTLPSSLATTTNTSTVIDTVDNGSGKMRTQKTLEVGSTVLLNYSGSSYLNGGNFGIGTTSPGAKLTIVSGGKGIHVDKGSHSSTSANLSECRTNYAFAYDTLRNGSTTGFFITNVGTNTPAMQAVDSSNNAQNISIQPYGGNVGIGTTSPDFKLDTRISRASGSFLTDGQVYALGLQNTDTTAGNATAMAFGHGGYKYTNFIASVRTGTGANPKGDLVFGGRPTDASTFVERMRILANGNVGIGTTGPNQKLHVEGAISAGTANSTSGSLILVGKYNNGNIITIGGEYSNGGIVIGYGVKPSTTASGAFLSSSGLANLQRGAYNQVGSDHYWWGGTYQTVAEGSAVTMSRLMTLNGAGNLGLGTTSPNYRLHVDNSGLSTNSAALYVKNPNSSSNAVIAEFVGDSDAIQIKNINVGDYAIYNTQQSNGIALYDGTGGVEIHYNGSTRLEADSNGGIKVTGQLSATGDVVAYSSDERLKENIKPIENAVDKIKQLKGVTFDWNEKSQELGFEPSTKTNDVGVIAQDVEAVFPQLVHLAPFDIGSDEEGKATSKTGEDYKTVNYARLTAVLIEAVKEQQQQIDELKEIINGLTK